MENLGKLYTHFFESWIINKSENIKQTDIVVTVTNASRSPYFNMVSEQDGYVKLLVENECEYSRRQDVPIAYDMTTVAYVTRPDFIKNNNKVFDGQVKASLVPKERAVDIDDEIDFKIAEMLMMEIKENTDAKK